MIYLASTSPRRKRLLKEAGIKFKAIQPHYEEKNHHKMPPAELVKKHAVEKAASCVARIKEGTMLGSDTIVYCGGHVIGKPRHRPDAFKILSRLQGRWHTVYTGVAVLEVKGGKILKQKVFCERTKVKLKAMDRAAIKRYFSIINPLDKAGAYAIQSKNVGIIDAVKGSLSSAIGLPIEQLRKYL